MRRSVAGVIALAITAAVVLAACDGSDNGAKRSAPRTTTTAAADPTATRTATANLRAALKTAEEYWVVALTYSSIDATKLTPPSPDFTFVNDASGAPSAVVVTAQPTAVVLVTRATDGWCYGIRDEPPKAVEYGKAAGSHLTCTAADITLWSDDIAAGWG